MKAFRIFLTIFTIAVFIIIIIVESASIGLLVIVPGIMIAALFATCLLFIWNKQHS